MPRRKMAQPTGVPTSPVRIQSRSSMELSSEESSTIARLVLILRVKDYWMGAFIKWMLKADEDAGVENGISMETAAKALDNFKIVDSNHDWLKEESSREPLTEYLRHRLFPDQGDHNEKELRGDIEESDFLDLVKLWRLEYPEPSKRRRIPAGITQHESDPDSD